MAPRSKRSYKNSSKFIAEWLENPYAPMVHTWSITVFTAVFFLLAAFVLLENRQDFQAFADSTDTQVAIFEKNLGNNTEPIANNVIINNGDVGVHLIEDTHATVTCRAMLIDQNGCRDIQNAQYRFYRSDLETGIECDPNDENCYIGNCHIENDCSDDNDKTVTATCAIPVSYLADATDTTSELHGDTDWTCTITPQDHMGTGVIAYDTIEIYSLTALQIDNAINYGTVARGGNTGTNNQLVSVINSGNTNIDVAIDGTEMPCTDGLLPVSNQRFGLKNLPYEQLDSALNTTPERLDINLPKGVANTSMQTTYWGIAIPQDDVSGSCHGINTFTPLQS